MDLRSAGRRLVAGGLGHFRGSRGATGSGPDGGRQEPSARCAAQDAVAGLATQATLFTQAEFLRTVFEAVQCRGIGANAALALARDLIQSGEVLPVSSRRHEQILTHRTSCEAEQRIIRSTARFRMRAPICARAQKQALAAQARKVGATAEQARAISAILTGTGLSLVQGAAGAGRTCLTRMVRSALKQEGYRTLGTAPSHKATADMQAEAGFGQGSCHVLARLLLDIDAERIDLDGRTVIIVDEADRIGTSDMDRLLSACADSGALVLLLGDATHYHPTVPGAPFALLQRLQPPTRLDKIARQEGRSELDGAWMRAASVDFASGRTETALEAYDRMGHIAWEPRHKTAIENAVAAYVDHRIGYPEETRAMTVQWIQDAEAVARQVRARMKAAGVLGEAEIRITALPRGKSMVASPLSLSVGDELLFGEAISGPGWQINNADIGRVIAIDTSVPDDPVLLIEKLGQGNSAKRLRAPLSRLVGGRGQGEPPVPRFQHTYALTAQAAQGITVDVHVDLALRPRGQEATCLCATRHRRDFRMFVDLGRLQDDQRLTAPTRVIRQKGGPQRPRPDPALDPEDLKRMFYAECRREDGQGNISDDLPRDCLSPWAQGRLPAPVPRPENADPTEPFRQVPLPRRSELSLTAESLQARIRQRLVAPKGHRQIWQLLERKAKESDTGRGDEMRKSALSVIRTAVLALKQTLLNKLKAEAIDPATKTSPSQMFEARVAALQANRDQGRATSGTIPDFPTPLDPDSPVDWQPDDDPEPGPA